MRSHRCCLWSQCFRAPGWGMASPVSAREERPPAWVGGRGGSHSLRAVIMHLLYAQPHITPVVPALGTLPYSGGLTITDPTGNSMDRLRGFCSWGCRGPGRGSGEASGSQGPCARSGVPGCLPLESGTQTRTDLGPAKWGHQWADCPPLVTNNIRSLWEIGSDPEKTRPPRPRPGSHHPWTPQLHRGSSYSGTRHGHMFFKSKQHLSLQHP